MAFRELYYFNEPGAEAHGKGYESHDLVEVKRRAKIAANKYNKMILITCVYDDWGHSEPETMVKPSAQRRYTAKKRRHRVARRKRSYTSRSR